MSDLRVSEIRFIPGTPAEQDGGLLGFVSLLLNDAVRLDGITIRRTLAGDIRLSWPTRTDRRGGRHALVRPISDDARRDIETRILSALGPGIGAATASPDRQAECRP